MTFTTDKIFSTTLGLSQAVSEALASFKQLSVDNQLNLLGMLHQSLGCSLTSVAPGAARLFLTQGLLHRIKQMSHTEQLSALHDLLAGANTPIARQYGMFTSNTKLAFWSQLLEWMYRGEIIPIVMSHELSPSTLQLFKTITSLDYSEQIKLVSQVIIDMGIEPMTA